MQSYQETEDEYARLLEEYGKALLTKNPRAAEFFKQATLVWRSCDNLAEP